MEVNFTLLRIWKQCSPMKTGSKKAAVIIVPITGCVRESTTDFEIK